MKRRKTIKILGASLPLLSSSSLILGSCKNSANSVELNSQLCTPKQYELLIRLVDLIIPQSQTPSASAVGVHYRIEEILFNNYTGSIRNKFLNGLNLIQKQCLIQFGKNPKDCSNEELSKSLNLIISNTDSDSNLDTYPFYPLLKGLTVSAFFNSMEMQNYFKEKKSTYLR